MLNITGDWPLQRKKRCTWEQHNKQQTFAWFQQQHVHPVVLMIAHRQLGSSFTNCAASFGAAPCRSEQRSGAELTDATATSSVGRQEPEYFSC